MNIAVTGGEGFIGKHLTKNLIEQGHSVRILTHNKSKKGLKNNIFYGDIITSENLDDFLQNAEIVINLVGRFEPPFIEQMNYNVIGLRNICHAMVAHNIKKIIHISATAAYGSAGTEIPFSEQDALLPDTEYGLSKKIGEEIIQYYNQEYGMRFIIFRPTNIYGPGSTHGFIYKFLKTLKTNKSIVIQGDGLQRRDCLYVSDIVDAITRSLTLSGNHILNIGNGKSYSLLEIVKILENLLDKKITITYDQPNENSIRYLASNIGKIEKTLHWRPAVPLESGLKLLLSTMQVL